MRTAERNDAAAGGGAEQAAGESMIRRVTEILGAFRPDDEALGPSELARRTGLAKSTISRIAGELVTYRLLERAGTGYRLGLRLFEFGESASRPRDLRKVALPSMAALRNAVGLTVHLAVLEGAEVVYIEILPARATPRLPSRVGGRMPAHATGVGKALLAASRPEVVDALLEHELVACGPRTITSPARLRRELQRVREAGIAYEKEESAVGVSCAACAVHDLEGAAIAAVSAAGWSTDFDVRRVGLAVRTTAEAMARQVSRRSGWSF